MEQVCSVDRCERLAQARRKTRGLRFYQGFLEETVGERRALHIIHENAWPTVGQAEKGADGKDRGMSELKLVPGFALEKIAQDGLVAAVFAQGF